MAEDARDMDYPFAMGAISHSKEGIQFDLIDTYHWVKYSNLSYDIVPDENGTRPTLVPVLKDMINERITRKYASTYNRSGFNTTPSNLVNTKKYEKGKEKEEEKKKKDDSPLTLLHTVDSYEDLLDFEYNSKYPKEIIIPTHTETELLKSAAAYGYDSMTEEEMQNRLDMLESKSIHVVTDEEMQEIPVLQNILSILKGDEE